MIKKSLLLLGLLFYSSSLFSTLIDIQVADTIENVMPLLSEEGYEEPWYFTDIDEVLITRKTTMAGIEEIPVEGQATKNFFDAIQKRAIGLTARPLHPDYSKRAQNSLERAGFFFLPTTFSEFQFPRDVLLELYTGKNDRNEDATTGWYNGVLYASFMKKSITMIRFFKQLVNQGLELPRHIFFIDDQVVNINTINSIFNDKYSAAELAKEAGVEESFILLLRKKIEKIRSVHYRYCFLQHKKQIQEKVIYDIKRKLQSAFIPHWHQTIAEATKHPLSEYTVERKKFTYNTCALMYDHIVELLNAVDALLNDYDTKYKPKYGSLSEQLLAPLIEEQLTLKEELLPRIYIFLKDLRTDLYRDSDGNSTHLSLDQQVVFSYEDVLDTITEAMQLAIDTAGIDDGVIEELLNTIQIAIESYKLHLLLYTSAESCRTQQSGIDKRLQKEFYKDITQKLLQLHAYLIKLEGGKKLYTKYVRKIKAALPNFTPPDIFEQRTKITEYTVDEIDINQFFTHYPFASTAWFLLTRDDFKKIDNEALKNMLYETCSFAGAKTDTFIAFTQDTFNENDPEVSLLEKQFSLHSDLSYLDLFGCNEDTGEDAVLVNSTFYTAGLPYSAVLYNILLGVAFKDMSAIPPALIVIGKRSSIDDIKRIFTDPSFDAEGKPATLDAIRSNVNELVAIVLPEKVST